MRSLLSASLIILLGQTANAEPGDLAATPTVVFWDYEATIGNDGKFHHGLHFSQNNIHVEYVSWADGHISGGKEIHVRTVRTGPGTARNCERFHAKDEVLLVAPEKKPRHKLKSLVYRYDDRTISTVKLYVFVGNDGALVPKTEPGGNGWYTYELPVYEEVVNDSRGRPKTQRQFTEFDFQSQDSPLPRGKRFYIAHDNKANFFIDDIQFVR